MKRSKFSLSHYKLFSADMGPLVPVACYPVLPGDTIQQSTALLLRCSPLLSPVMHPVHVRIHHWFVPYRILWDDWEDFITGGRDGMALPPYPVTNFQSLVGSLSDYLGVPTDGKVHELTAFPYRAYAMIYNEWYRDQDLVDPLPISTTGGNDSTTNRELVNCAWEKDYFTSARPWPQKGPEVTLPIGATADITLKPGQPAMFRTQPNDTSGYLQHWFTQNNGSTTVQTGVTAEALAGGMIATEPAARGGDFYISNIANPNNPLKTLTVGMNLNQLASNLQADLSSAGSVSINDLREAFALQRYEEARARYGSRYTEYLRYLGVRSSDARLQRPEYLGGGKQTIQFSEVLRTGDSVNGPIGQLNGHGIAAMRSNRYRRFFEEHGLVMSLMSVKPRTIYQDGLQRAWTKRYKEEHWQRELQHIGQQEVRNDEIYAASTDPAGTFGFQDRYDEYRRVESGVAGEFRTSQLNYWHFARQFANQPVLNGSFVTANPTKRVFAEQTQHSMYIMASHSIQARRLLAKTGKSFIF